jgi:hypothetical protein
MNKEQLKKYIEEVTWDDVKDLPHTNNRMYHNDIVERKDVESNTTGRLYLIIFEEPNEDGKDRYFGSQTTSTVAIFMESDYTSSTETQTFFDSMSGKDWRIICLKVGQDSSILVEEEKVLKEIDAVNNVPFFNESNVSGTKLKTLGIQEEIFDKIINNIQNEVYKTGKDTINHIYNLRRAQPRMFDINLTHVNNIGKDIEATKGKAIKTIRPTILLEDFYGPGQHQRGGNTHSIEAMMKENVRRYVKELKVIFVPKSDWSKCSPETLRDILRWDNAKDEPISRMNTDEEEIIESCLDLCLKYGLSHKDERVRKRARMLGASSSTDWDKIRPKLRVRLNGEISDNELPPNMERIIYTDADIKEIENPKDKSDNHDIKVISTVYAANGFNGWDFFVRWLDDPANLKRTLHTPFLHGRSSFKKYADMWPDKQKDLIPIIENLFKAYGKEGHWTWDVLARWQPKKNKVTVND